MKLILVETTFQKIVLKGFVFESYGQNFKIFWLFLLYF